MTEAGYKYRPLRVLWNEIAFAHPVAVNLSIATAAVWRRQVSGSLGPIGLQLDIADYPESSRYYSRSLARTVERLSNETDRTSDAVIATVLGLACYDVCSLLLLGLRKLTLPLGHHSKLGAMGLPRKWFGCHRAIERWHR